MSTFRLAGLRVVVKDGFRCNVYDGRKLIGHWCVSFPAHETLLGIADDARAAGVAVQAALERMQSQTTR